MKNDQEISEVTLSERVTIPEIFTVTSQDVVINQVSVQKRNQTKAYCVSYQAKINSVVEGQNPTNILGLPNETWEQIISNLNDITDIQSCLNTCQQFRLCLSASQKALLQLKKVLPILLRLRYLNIKSMFDLRLVSKDVCQFIKTYLESNNSWFNYEVPYIVYALIPSLYNFLELQKRFKFGQKAKARALIRKSVVNDINSTNPFLSRFLIICNDTSSRQVAHGNIINFLEEWGAQIWYLELLKSCTKVDLLEILRLLPNLKYLRLCGKISEGEENSQDNYSDLLKEVCPKVKYLVISIPKNDIASVYDNLHDVFKTQLENYFW